LNHGEKDAQQVDVSELALQIVGQRAPSRLEYLWYSWYPHVERVEAWSCVETGGKKGIELDFQDTPPFT